MVGYGISWNELEGLEGSELQGLRLGDDDAGCVEQGLYARGSPMVWYRRGPNSAHYESPYSYVLVSYVFCFD